MNAQLTILGSNSALPAQGRHPSAQILHVHQELFLIDCGEGTQLQMSAYSIRRSKISTIFISHLHGDHIYGLPGLITSYNHFGRSNSLTIYGPVGLRNFIDCSVYITGNPLNFELIIEEFDPDEKRTLIDTEWLAVTTQPLQHRIPTAGFIFSIKNPLLKIKPGVFDEYNVPFEQRTLIQKGADFITSDGERLSNQVFTEKPAEPVRYAYYSDTAYIPDTADAIRGVDTLYHEATFLHALADKADMTRHSTALQAAQMAKNADVKQLIIGHFSSRYDDLQSFLDEARPVFPNTKLALEGKVFEIG